MKPFSSLRKPSRRRGQSFVEIALFMPILLLMIGGMAEVAFFINDYLDLLDASRESARYGTNLVHTSSYVQDSGAPCTGATDHFFYVVACLASDNIQSVGNLKFDPSEDDIVISVFTVQDGEPDAVSGSDPLPEVKERFPDETEGWSFATDNASVGCGGTCPSRFTDLPGDGVTGPLETVLQSIPSPSGYGDLNDAVVVVEVFYAHYQRLGLPFYNFLPNPIRMYAYSIFPIPSAEPTATAISP